MIYRICINNEDIYGTDLDNSVISPSLEIELNSAGSLNFTLPPEHIQWDKPNVFVDEVDVYEDDDIIWFGRPLQVTRDWNNQKKVICEGALAYFNDSVQRPKEYKLKNTTLRQFFEDIIDMHNLQVASNRKIYPGNFTVDDVPVYRKVDYETTAECLQRYCLDTDGGYFILRKERNPEDPTEWLRYIDWVSDLQGRSDQPVQFGLNMLDIAQDLNGADICTVLIPTGGDDLLVNNVATQTVNGCRHVKGEDEIVFVGAEDPTNPEGIHKYGRVLKQKEWSDIYDKDQLFQKACEWLVEQNTDIPTIECAAADLHYLPEYEDQYGSETGKFRVGQKVHVVS
ncbi:MAG: phage tail protein, partial [Clostridiales bacterium]|nr:phage tail protein [Clostridiales bacterium]